MKIQWNSIIVAMGLKDREFNRHNRVCIHFILIYFYRNSPDIVITETDDQSSKIFAKETNYKKYYCTNNSE
ncbi:hypothetical protein T4A_13145 [Trichinella pseudospiralis]|uniref:Uncharacterized protein n=1 Tax=Trichinella pseudospiralis TaxID=6337 RepID=A0A0V1J6F0_TRIPS|nr:hypothetical protein T4A_13145 [Trichinella pseudospiralis]KRZ30547.1 hypothetical protein T4C_8789 [Trichinella pseudospiralis]